MRLVLVLPHRQVGAGRFFMSARCSAREAGTGDDTPFIGENIPFAEYTKQFGNIRHSRFVFYIAARYL